jgi:sporulation protein YlmC with PRC-barrel domain
MRTRYLVGGLLAAALLSSTAIAQTTAPAPSANPPAATTASNQTINKSTHWRASKMKGLNVYNEQNEKVGDINDIILDKDSKVTGYVIGVGGFLGMGEHDVMFEPGKIKFVNEPVRTASTTTTTTTTTNPPPANPNAAPTTTKNVSATTRTTEWYPDHAVISGTKDQLKAMPQFKY